MDVDEVALEEFRGRVARWRSKHGGRGRRLPDWVWAGAGVLARRVGADRVSRALKLREERVAAVAEVAPPTEIAPPTEVRVEAPTFVELPPDMVLGAGVVVELELRGAARARVRGGDPDVVARLVWRLLDEDRRCSS